MSSSDAPSERLPEEFLAAFQEAAGVAGVLPFDQFMGLALYHPEFGYYRAAAQRVGRGGETDFFTASSTGPLFGELVVAACRTILAGADLGKYTFVEIGAEPGGGVLREVAHGFGAVRTIRIGEPITISGSCVVFSNELFDAQPFRRVRYRAGQWRELGVGLDKGTLHDTEISGRALPPILPAHAAEGYVIDLPLAAADLSGGIASQPWQGLFLAFDYGKSWKELIEAAPGGTARAYSRHKQSNDLLARPGRQDLTCHICWDWLAERLRAGGFAEPILETQEAFFVRRAGDCVAKTIANEAPQLSQRKLALIQLLQNLGQKFQVLWALRESLPM